MAYQAEARIVCMIVGPAADVTIGRDTALLRSHPVFHTTAMLASLLAVQKLVLGSVGDVDPAQCAVEAKKFLYQKLPPTFTIDETFAVDGTRAVALPPGHAWVNGHWVPTNAAYVAHAFPLLYNGVALQDPECQFRDPGDANDQLIQLRWYVVVQPKS